MKIFKPIHTTRQQRYLPKALLYKWMNEMKPKEIKKYTVWVGGTEITDFFVTYAIAKELLKQYQALGYDDVSIQQGRK